jgi:hypothetical protein
MRWPGVTREGALDQGDLASLHFDIDPLRVGLRRAHVDGDLGLAAFPSVSTIGSTPLLGNSFALFARPLPRYIQLRGRRSAARRRSP